MNKKDLEHLEFIYSRLIYRYDESEEVDFMIRFKEVIDKEASLSQSSKKEVGK